ncbi:hypothetical protein P7B02_18935 [Caulobacter segnis]|uniref:hypothetical protein n=1 Tax=Caulobacter segnis TaxID=88688 RepID=UPI00240F6093|nr:hypothetical protein [Caulobacter segnis]MDG2523608.1 hypothetical protein [Caulobacter segnis]
MSFVSIGWDEQDRDESQLNWPAAVLKIPATSEAREIIIAWLRWTSVSQPVDRLRPGGL